MKRIAEDEDEQEPGYVPYERAFQIHVFLPPPVSTDGKCKSCAKEKRRCNKTIDECKYLEEYFFLDRRLKEGIEDMSFDHHEHSPTAEKVDEFKPRRMNRSWCAQRSVSIELVRLTARQLVLDNGREIVKIDRFGDVGIDTYFLTVFFGDDVVDAGEEEKGSGSELGNFPNFLK